MTCMRPPQQGHCRIGALASAAAASPVVACGTDASSISRAVVKLAAFAVLAVPSLPLMYLSIITVGLGLGIATTTTLSGVVDMAPAEARGTALSLRITGNRVGQVLVPFLASLIAVAAGTAGILLVIALTLGASGTAVGVNRQRPG